MEIEPIFTNENWKDFLSDLRDVIHSFYIAKNENQNYLTRSIINEYGNKIEILIPEEQSPPEISSPVFIEFISILESILNKQPLKNHIFSFSIKFSELMPEKSWNESYKRYYWRRINNMNICLLRVYTVLEGHYFQAPLLQINSVRMDPEKKYPLNFTCRIMNEDMANAYKFVRNI